MLSLRDYRLLVAISILVYSPSCNLKQFYLKFRVVENAKMAENVWGQNASALLDSKETAARNQVTRLYNAISSE